MKKLIFKSLLAALMLVPAGVFAQGNKPVNAASDERDYVFLFGNAHRDTAVVRVLFENAPKYFNAPDMPRFAIIGKDRKFYLGIGGYVKGTLSYDLGNPIESPIYFETSSIPMDNRPGNGTMVQFSAATSNLFFNFVALPHSKNKIGAYVNFNFTGGPNTYGFNLRSAYITYRNFIVGYNTSLFTDGAASAPTIDQQGPNGMTFVFNTVIDYQYTINKHWSFGLGLEMPAVSATYNEYNYALNQRVPDIPAYIQYRWADGNGWARLSGLWRNMYYRNDVDNETVDRMGWAVKLSGALPFGKKLTVFYQGVYGKGIGSYIQDMQGYGLDMVPVAGRSGVGIPASYDGRLENVEAWGMYAGLQYQITHKLLASATYSMVNSYLPSSEASAFIPAPANGLENAYMPGSTYKSAKYVVANMFYSITPSVTAGIEYLWGCRENADGAFKQDTRLQTAIRVNF